MQFVALYPATAYGVGKYKASILQGRNCQVLQLSIGTLTDIKGKGFRSRRQQRARGQVTARGSIDQIADAAQRFNCSPLQSSLLTVTIAYGSLVHIGP